MMLRGMRRLIGKPASKARPVTVFELHRKFARFVKSEGDAFWLAIFLCFRVLLRKANVCEKGLAILLGDIVFYQWDVLVTIHRSETFGFMKGYLGFSLEA